jgi:hypothetical protein
MVVMAVLGILSTLKITPSVPPWLGYALLVVLVALATVYWAGCVVRLWPQVVGRRGIGPYRLQPRFRPRRAVQNLAEQYRMMIRPVSKRSMN